MAARLIAVALLALGLLPIANWIPGGESDPEYVARMLDWLNGLLLCAGVGALAWYMSTVRARRAPGALVAESRARRGALIAWVGPTIESRPRVLIAVAAFALYAIVARFVFSGRPLLIDEIVQVLQARWYADGQLSVATSEPRVFTSILHLVDLGDRTFSQFPAGGPAMLALGALVHAEWLVGPACGAISVWLFGRLLRETDPNASIPWRLGATVLFALAPFGVFMFGSHMNHATATMWLLAAALSLALATRAGASPWWGLVTGLALGAAAAIRPVDGVAFALPAAAWLAWRARIGRVPLAALLLSGIGVALPLSALLWVNARTTGEPLLFGYDLLWGAGHSLGFHSSPWGPVHTPARGLELISLYVTRLAIHLFETPFPAILPAAAALWFARRLGALDRYLLAASVLLLGAYWAYWHDGYYLGPRFVFPLLPLFVLWSARLPTALASLRAWSAPMRHAGLAASITAVSYAAVFLFAVRVPQYRNGMTSMRTDIESASASAGVRDALVLVKESWGAGLLVRMWALGVSRSDAEVIYRTADACKLELTISALEADGTRDAAARARLTVLQADSSALEKSTRSPDFTERMLPGYAYAPVCEAAVAADGEGFSHLAPFRLARDGNVYVRWLPGREGEIASRYPDRTVYLLGRASSAVNAPLTWTRWTRPAVR
jgi:hypothetical protein